jgi:Mg-chelatase subunit ChlI
VRAGAALRPKSVESRFEALRTATTPLVGRDEEIELLMRRWTQAKSGDGSVVLISGEPGIGKSRITDAVQERLNAEPHTRLRFFCSPHHQESKVAKSAYKNKHCVPEFVPSARKGFWRFQLCM